MGEHDPRAAKEFLRKADDAMRHSELVRKAVVEAEELNTDRIEEAAKK
jgi:hypothetical protein